MQVYVHTHIIIYVHSTYVYRYVPMYVLDTECTQCTYIHVRMYVCTMYVSEITTGLTW